MDNSEEECCGVTTQVYNEIKKHEVKLSGSQCVVSSCVFEASLNFYTVSHQHIHVLTSIHVCVSGEVCASIQSFFYCLNNQEDFTS